MAEKFELPEELKENTNLVAGVWRGAGSGKTFEVKSPVTGEVLGRVPLCDPSDVDRAVEAARKVWEPFRLTPVFERSALVRRISELISARAEIIGRVLTMEQGKSYFREALPEVRETARNFQIAAEDIVRLETPVIPMEDPNKRVFTFREAVGTMAVITPWNFPTVIPSEYLGPSLAAGNTIIMKPASYTPLSMILVGRCIQDALDDLGYPKGVFNLITGPGGKVGDYLVGHPGVDMIGFTGETLTGTSICSRAGIKRTLMELGGNGPQIVCSDANIEEAARAAAFGCFFNAGQVCCATERILVDRKVHDEFLGLLVKEAETWRLGDPMEEETCMGPLNNEPTVAKTKTHLEDAVAKGARILLGGRVQSGWRTDLYFPATVIDGVSRDSLLNKEETFGPVAPVITFQNDEEAVQIANESGYGLQMSVFTSSIKRCFFYASRLRTGNIVFNDTTDYWEAHEPFGGGGGTKSGYGRLGGRYTLDDVTHLKTCAIDIEKVL
ncbi:MAG: aldehyde dehydrogenase [Deltaproteobacteria bacterium]|nr:aldehyde dehydrogenase [Deltaproteobacteria bacterium]